MPRVSFQVVLRECEGAGAQILLETVLTWHPLRQNRVHRCLASILTLMLMMVKKKMMMMVAVVMMIRDIDDV